MTSPSLLPKSSLPRVVIVGAGFAGLTVAQKLRKNSFQVVLIDRNNYHQFQPLFYQVAMSGLEPSSILFPLRKTFQETPNVLVRIAEVSGISPENNTLHTTLGDIDYDHLVIATGANTNYFGNESLQQQVIPMKSVSEALYLRNKILEDFEAAVTAKSEDEIKKLLNICIVGGGPTGVELAGAIAEMRSRILPKDYPEIDINKVNITLVQGASRLLDTMSESASEATLGYLKNMGVNVVLSKFVTQYDGQIVTLNDSTTLEAGKVIWAAGVTGQPPKGLAKDAMGHGNRIRINEFMQVVGYSNIYALGDAALLMNDEKWPKGHPQVAQVALQMGERLAANLKMAKSDKIKPFIYKDLGSMATIGRNKAVVDLPFWHFKGFFAWVVWMFIHLISLIGARNKMVVFLNWIWSYFTYDQSLRLLIKPFTPKKIKNKSEVLV